MSLFRKRYKRDPQPDDENSERVTVEVILDRDKRGNLRRQSDGNLWSSELGWVADWAAGPNPVRYHAPIIDLDYAHSYVPSKTPGHGHLFIHKAVPEDKLRNLIEVLVDCGLAGRGNLNQFKAHGAQFAFIHNDAGLLAGTIPVPKPEDEDLLDKSYLN